MSQLFRFRRNMTDHVILWMTNHSYFGIPHAVPTLELRFIPKSKFIKVYKHIYAFYFNFGSVEFRKWRSPDMNIDWHCFLLGTNGSAAPAVFENNNEYQYLKYRFNKIKKLYYLFLFNRFLVQNLAQMKLYDVRTLYNNF